MALFTQTNTFINGTTADGSQVNTEIVNLGTSVNDITNAQINAAAAIALTKLATYTAFTPWTPSLGAGGAMNISAPVQNISKYMQLGSMYFFQFNYSFTAGGVANNVITFTLPATPSGSVYGGGCGIYDNGNRVAGFWEVSSGTTVQVYRYDYGNFTLEANKKIMVNGFFST